MYRKILSFILAICLCMGMMPTANVYAAEERGDQEELPVIANFIAADDQDVYEGTEIEIPQNGSVVQMEDVTEAQPAMFRLPRENEERMSAERYTVLLLDISSSLTFYSGGSLIYKADTAFPYVHAASKKFVEDMGKASGKNHIAIIAFNETASWEVSPFTDDVDALLKAIDSLFVSAGGGNVHSGLTAAEELIDSVSDQGGSKNVVLFTTGLAYAGPYSYDGPYNAFTVGGRWNNMQTNIPVYAYANAAYAAAEALKEKCTVYSIGLFQAMDEMPEAGRDLVQFLKLCACDWASSKKHFYDIKDPTYLEFVFGQIADNITKCTGRFSYPGVGEDYTAEYFYDDNYFKESSYEYNQSLATMSLCLELSAWGSEEESDYTRKMRNAEALLNELGFVGFDHNYTDFTEEGVNGKPTKDSVGMVAANKLLSFDGKDYTLIAVAVRGGGYEREWASNFTMGAGGHHEGFSRARDIVIAFLQNYVKEQRISGDIKIWITGYSRAAATANMVAGAIDNGTVYLSGCNLEAKDLFAYTFETPAGVMDAEARSQKYSNIFNIINNNDSVPLVAPQEWKFTRYGKDQNIPTPELDTADIYKEKKNAMLWMYRKMGGYKSYDVDDFARVTKADLKEILSGGTYIQTKKDMSQREFLDKFVTLLANNYLKDRQNYVANYQSGIRDICGIYFGTDSKKTDKLKSNLLKELALKWGRIVIRAGKNDKAGVYELLTESLEKSLKEAEITYNEAEFANAMATLADLVTDLASEEPCTFATLVYNSPKIGQAHYPELCLAWMQSMDTNYTTNAKSGFAPGKYRIVRVNCPIDVTVYDAEGNEMASIINDVPQPDAHVVAYFNDEGEKIVYLPVYDDYVIKLTATADGVMNYAVHEYDSYAGETNHAVFFNDIQITAGQEYMAYLPRLTEEEIESMTGKAADTDYSLFLESEEIPCSEELKDEEVFDAYYRVSASAENKQEGFVFGSGSRQYGTFTIVTAIPYEGYELVGWYQDGKLVSTEEEYRFRVSEDIEFTAVFRESTKDETPDKNPEEGTGDGTDDGRDEGEGKGDGGTGEGTGDGTGEGTGDTGKDDRKSTIDGAFRVVAHWNTGFTGEITLTNTTDEVIHNWVVAFDLPYEMRGIWNGVIASCENGVYTIRNAGYNWDIAPGESVTFGFYTHAETETITEPTSYTLIEKPAQPVNLKYEIAWRVNSDWKTAFNGQFEISNRSQEEILDWTLEFDSPHHFDQFWNAEIVSHEGDHYVIKNRGYNAAVGAGQTLILGFHAGCISGDPIGSGREPVNYKLTAVNMK